MAEPRRRTRCQRHRVEQRGVHDGQHDADHGGLDRREFPLQRNGQCRTRRSALAKTGFSIGDGAMVTLTGVTVSDNQRGMYVRGRGNPTVYATGCTIIDNGRTGGHMGGSSPLVPAGLTAVTTKNSDGEASGLDAPVSVEVSPTPKPPSGAPETNSW